MRLSMRASIFIVAIVAAAIYLGFSAQQKASKAAKFDPSKVSATVFHQARDISPFKLTDDQGRPFTNANLKGQWTLMFFGFTNCPHVCPTTMAELNKVYQNLQKDNVQQLPQVLMVSVDPERDSVEKLHSYVASFNKNFMGARADKSQIDTLAKEVSVMYMKVNAQGKDATGNEEYNIEHSGAVLMLNPQGQLVALFGMPHDATVMTKDIAYIESTHV